MVAIQEIHVSYTYYTFLVVGYGYNVQYQGSTGPGAMVTHVLLYVAVTSPWR